jgi:glycosyltransferase involved in cell wall biosynthesis
MSRLQTGYAFLLPWSPDRIGGVNEVVRNLMRECLRSGCCEPLLIENRWEASRLTEEGSPVGNRVALRMPSPWDQQRPVRALVSWLGYLPFTLMRLRELVSRYNVSVLNAHFPDLFCLNLVMLKRLGLFGGKLVLSVHGSDIRLALSAAGWHRWLWKQLFRNCDYIVSCSADLGREVTTFDPAASERLRVIHNGLDIDAFTAETDLAFTLPEALAGRSFLLNIGTYLFWKGHDILLHAFALLAKKRSDLVLVVIGARGGQLPQTQELVRHLGLEDRVLLLENVPHARIPVFLKAATALVVSSRWRLGSYGEGFPIALLEAAAAVTPVISAASCGVRELIEDGVTGRVVPCEDPGALAAALEELLQSPQETRHLAENLHMLVRTSFQWSGAFRQYLALVFPYRERAN